MNEKKSVLDPKKEVKVGVVILNVDEVIKNEIKKFDEAVTEDKLVAAVEGYRGLKIMGIDDKDGYDAVHQARIVLKNMRIAVDTRRKDLKADFLKVGNAIEAQAKHLIGILEPTEKYLAAQEKVVDDEVERLKKEAKEKAEKERRDRIEGRVAMLREIGFTWGKDAFYDFDGGVPITMVQIEEWPEDDFHAFHFKHKAQYNEWLLAEEKRKAEEARAQEAREALRKAESERLAKERAELEMLAKARKLEEEQLAKQRVDQEKAAAEEREKLRIQQKELEDFQKRLKAEIVGIRTNTEGDVLRPTINPVAGAKVGFEKVLVADPASEVQTVHSGVVEFSARMNKELEDIILRMNESFYSTKSVCLYEVSDPVFQTILDNVKTLIDKTQAYFSKEVEKWQANQKSTKQTK